MWICPDDTTNLQKPQDIRYMKILRFNLTSIAAWDYGYIERVNYKSTLAKKVYVICLEYLCLMLGTMYLVNSTRELSIFELGHTYITVFMNIIACSRLTLIFMESYHKLVVQFLNEIHIFNNKEKSDQARQMHLTVHRLSHYFTIYINFVGILGLCSFLTIPIYNNVSSGAYSTPRPQNVTLQQSVYYELPFDYKTDLRAHTVLFIYNVYIAYVCSSCFLSFDLLISLIVFHVWGHVKILIHNLEHFPRPLCLTRGCKCYRFSEEEMKYVHIKLHEYIVHHNLIIGFIGSISNIFGWVLLMYHAFHLICGCFLLLQCSQLDANALTRYGLLTVATFQQLIQMSVVFELLASQYDKLSSATYSMPWEFMDTENRKLVFIMLRQTQKPINLKAAGMVTVGVQTMTTILKTSFSYFIMLRTMADGK